MVIAAVLNKKCENDTEERNNADAKGDDEYSKCDSEKPGRRIGLGHGRIVRRLRAEREQGRTALDVTACLPRTRVADSPGGRTGWAAGYSRNRIAHAPGIGPRFSTPRFSPSPAACCAALTAMGHHDQRRPQRNWNQRRRGFGGDSEPSPGWGDCGDIRQVNEGLAPIEAFLNGNPTPPPRVLRTWKRNLRRRVQGESSWSCIIREITSNRTLQLGRACWSDRTCSSPTGVPPMQSSRRL